MATKHVLSAFLVLVILSSSIYFLMPGKVRIDIENTRTLYSVFEKGNLVLGATEYVYLFDGTTKMRASSREVTYWNDTEFAYALRKSTWKDNITTEQLYTFEIVNNEIEKFPLKNEFKCINCVGKIVHFEYRDIDYDGETKEISSPFRFGHNMKLEWGDRAYYSKVFQSSTVSDKIVIRYRPENIVETYSVKLTDPVSNPSDMIKNGTKAYWERDGFGRIECPYSIKGRNVEINCELESYYPAQKDLDICFAFPEKISGNSLIWKNVSHDVVVDDYGNVTHSYTCNSNNFSYTLSPKHFWCYADNGTSDLLFEHDFEGGNLETKTAWWNEWKKVGNHIEQKFYFDWVSIPNNKWVYKRYDSSLGSHWYCLKDVTLKTKEVKKFKGVLKRNSFNDMKYSICAKLSTDTLSEAIANDRYFCLDPWWNNSYNYKRADTVTHNSSGILLNFTYVINGTSGFDLGNDGTNQAVWANSDINATNYLYYNDNTDYAMVNESENAELCIDVEYGNLTRNDRCTWDKNKMEVRYSFTSSGTTVVDSLGNNNGTFSGTLNRTKINDCMFGECAGDTATDNYISLSRLGSGTSASGLTIWFRQLVSQDANRLFYQVTDANNYGACYINNDVINCLVMISGGTTSVTYTIPAATNHDWHHLAYFCDQNNQYLYLDGVQVDSDLTGGRCWEDVGTDNTRLMGSSLYGNTFDGYIDEFRFYDEIKSGNWVKREYEMGLSSLGVEQAANQLPVIGTLNCSNGTAWKTSFNWNENVEQCQVSCSDQDAGEPIYVNFTSEKGISPYDGDNDNSWFEISNTSTGLSLYTMELNSYLQSINESGDYNITAYCGDGKAVVSNSITWSVDYGTLSVVLDYPVSDISVQNGTAWPEQAHGYITCNNGECFNVTAYLDPIKNER